MRFQDIELYEDNQLEKFTIITCSPQTNASWLAQGISDRINAKIVAFEAKPVQSPNLVSKSLVLTNLELPVLCGASSAKDVMKIVQELLTQCEKLVVCITLSDALVDPYYETGQQLAQLGVLLLYEAQLILQLQPLPTGRARDITGRLVVARGPKAIEKVMERELFYFVQKTVEIRECV